MAIKRTIKLGDTARDIITGFEGVVVARTEWLYNCVRFTLQPKELKDGAPLETVTFDEDQLQVVDLKVVPEKAVKTGGPRPEPQRPRI